ncbi:MAG: polyprenol monophosphomannose synthase [Patescibacteria group bacterium]
MKTYIVIPTYNEKDNLEILVKKISALKIENSYIIVVDDNSPDNTGVLADKLAEDYNLSVIHRPTKQGLGSAYKQGFAFAIQNNADLIIQMDADLSHNPKDIPRLIESCLEGYDLVIGSRKIKGGQIINWNLWRKFCSWGAMSFARLALNIKTKDLTAGFRCFKKTALQKINFQNIESNGYAWLEEIIYLAEKNNLKIKEIPVAFTDRRAGQSKLGKKEIVEFFKTILRLKFRL